MKMNISKITSFILLFATVSIIYLTFTQIDCLSAARGSSAANRIRILLSLSNFTGALLGIVLCPLFLPVPGKNKKTPLSIVFILIVFIPNIIIMSLGAEAWLSSTVSQIIMSFNSGIFYPIAYGLFFISRRQNRDSEDQSRQTRITAMELSILIIAAMILRYVSIPFLEYFGIAANPMRALSFVFKIIEIFVIIMFLSAISCVYFLKPDCIRPAVKQKTNTSFILRLVTLSLVFTSLNMMVELRLFPLMPGVVNGYMFYLPAAAAAVLVLAFFSDKQYFLQSYLFAAALLFIILPCLTLLQNPLIITILSTLASILHFSKWSLFSVYITENYKGGFWFYGSAMSIHITNMMSVVGSIFIPVVPSSPGSMVLLSAIAAIIFIFLSFKLVVKKHPILLEQMPQTESPKSYITLTDSFNNHKLTKREAEIAEHVFNGLKNSEIAEKLFLTEATIKKNMTAILEKYKAKSRSDFMSKTAYECGLK